MVASPAKAVIDPLDLRSALGAFPTGVTIVTTRSADQDVGLTVNSFNSVSLDPPLVLWSLSAKSASRSAFEAAEYFVVHVLSAQQEELASRFARKDVDRFEGLAIKRGPEGAPLIQGCAARFVCRRAHQYQGGDHLIIVGEVVALERLDRPALAFHAGKFAFALPRGVPPPAPHDDDSMESVDANAVNMLLGLAHTYLAQRLKPHLDAREISELDYWLLSIIGARSGRRIDKLAEMLSFSGLEVGASQPRALASRGYIEVRTEDGVETAWLTTSGRTALIELAAASKAVEMTLERRLDYAEVQLLWELLRRLIVSTLPAEAVA